MAETEQTRNISHGRGGAGNIGKSNTNSGATTADLRTPIIKSDLYTTGRGGSGNMATNLKEVPEMARAAQDVEPPAHVGRELKGTYHWGRGGEGNKTTVGVTRQEGKDAPRASSRDRSADRAGINGSGAIGGVVDKGREMLGLGRKKS